MKTRITADLDFKDRNKLTMCLNKALHKVKGFEKLELYKSSNKGYHLIVWSNKKYTLKQQYAIREKIGDDKSRIKLDKKRKFGRQTLFNIKKWKRN